MKSQVRINQVKPLLKSKSSFKVNKSQLDQKLEEGKSSKSYKCLTHDHTVKQECNRELETENDNMAKSFSNSRSYIHFTEASRVRKTEDILAKSRRPNSRSYSVHTVES